MATMVATASSKTLLTTIGNIADAIPHSEDEQAALKNLLVVSTTVLHQALDLIDNVLTSDDELTTNSQFLSGSTIGKHLRHARDHFVILLDSISSPEPHVFNYDVRTRNTPMESSRKAAREAIGQAIRQLEEVVPRARLDEPMTLNAVTPFPQVLQTSFGRELWFAALHAVHHWSMIRVIAGEQGLKLEESFGFAPSTLVYRGSDAVLGKANL
ncbi:hypothetical protein JAAARDRAFT_37856 [Jaapia argillacea MUCL 33604]|uniref:DinB-like domain-containing protein n=1 Tax=Jaapia argillacea MUCL 33604 TaxID=933084 RepID=A0A067PTY9_9AGAM|nr:hypothetical protein JAAARDRAFT_37856 [Jaapia argillacea MUCL 33604]